MSRRDLRERPSDTDPTAGYEATRREAVGRGLAVSGGVIAAGVPALLHAAHAVAGPSGDADVLEGLLGLEQSAVYAYLTMASSGKLGSETRMARLFAEQEQKHADALARALKRLGGNPPAKPVKVGDVPGLGEAAAGAAREMLTFAVDLEMAGVRAYYEALGRLRGPRRLSLGANIMADEAQHLVVLRQALDRNPSPDAFVTGDAA